ncbi:anaphase-promoting complex subunit Apc11 [Thelephora ganbajun]|uniref:Anaphase-promoting complex subunit Apc11 n=1 Tax=Thelephora ganbajun TaxID=370292 RepID=A0ACB6ZMN5_THEGA|nr:anaphase-promoting complex subunit Apc11 [Thelephora ganbajun]
MKVKIKSWHAIAQWRWDTGNADHDEGDGEGDVCGICRVPYEGCCPTCKVPGDDCPLIWGECSHVFHMHCLLKWIGTPASKQQCPMDRRTWVTAERKVPSQASKESEVSA